MPTLDELLAAYPPDVQATARRARALILDVLPDAAERVRLGWKNVTFGRGPAMGDTLFAVCPQRTRVNLNLWGADLPDPAGLLEGTGVRMRHVKLASPAEVEAPALRALLEAAVAAGASMTPAAGAPAAAPGAAPPPRGYKLDVSRTLDAAAAELYAAWADPARRARWLVPPAGAGPLEVRTATPERSLRGRWADGSTVAATFEARGARRARVGVEHARVASRAAADALKAYWRERLDALAAHLAAPSPTEPSVR